MNWDLGGIVYEQKKKKIENVMYNIHDKLWGDDIINFLICIFISTVQELFCKY